MSIDGLPLGITLSHIPGMFDRDDEPERVSVSLSGDEIEFIVNVLVRYRNEADGLTVQQRDESRKLEAYLERMTQR
jgi:hypothetical protein